MTTKLVLKIFMSSAYFPEEECVLPRAGRWKKIWGPTPNRNNPAAPQKFLSMTMSQRSANRAAEIAPAAVVRALEELTWANQHLTRKSQ